LSGTVNSRSNTEASIQQIGEPVQYEKLQRWCNKYRKLNKPAPKARKATQAKPRNNTAKLPTRNAYTLHWNRIQDYHTLGESRGGYSDHRRRVTALYAASLAWYCRDTESLYRELAEFSDRYIINPSKYHIDAIVKRAEGGWAGETKDYNGKQVDVRYRYLNKTIIDQLEITETEQAKLRTIFGKVEKQTRNTNYQREKRRKAGVVEREQYEAGRQKATEKRIQEALELRAKGLTHKQIGIELGMTRQGVSKLLKGEATGVSPCMY